MNAVAEIKQGQPHQAHLDKFYGETPTERIAVRVMGWEPNDLTTPLKEGEYIFNSSGIRQWAPDNRIKIFDPYNKNEDALAVLEKSGPRHPLALLTREHLQGADATLAKNLRDAICRFALQLTQT